MSIVETFPDVEGGLRDWLRTVPTVTAVVAQRVFFGIPDNPTWPLITIARVGGGDDTSEAPIDLPLIQFDCWGGIDVAGHGLKAEADQVRRALRGALKGLRQATQLNPTTVAYGADVVSDIWAPDPDSNRPRYVVTAQVTARAA